MLNMTPTAKKWLGTAGFLLAAFLLTALSSPAAAQIDNTSYGDQALLGNTGNDNSAFGAFSLDGSNAGDNNSAFGAYALFNNFDGFQNTATGEEALQNFNGHDNTATGFRALFGGSDGSISIGYRNTATGSQALMNDTGGYHNTATGSTALGANTIGNDNTATGSASLQANIGGNFNTADGGAALYYNQTGNYNTAAGSNSLVLNVAGSNNTATGYFAMYNTRGSNNTATGRGALYSNTGGNFNTAIGFQALFHTTGGNNIGVGNGAGTALTTGTNNIDIGAPGLAAESGTIRIGDNATQAAIYIGGISKSQVSGADVTVASNGRLGVVLSSARFKRDIRDMGETSAGLMKLRPVNFSYRADPTNARQYGLVAEEVREVYPELVTYDSDGKVESVRYTVLTSMLVNELQKRTVEIAKLSEQMVEMQKRLATLERAMGTNGNATVAAVEDSKK